MTLSLLIATGKLKQSFPCYVLIKFTRSSAKFLAQHIGVSHRAVGQCTKMPDKNFPPPSTLASSSLTAMVTMVGVE